jgi:hypothetical protein
LTVAAEAAGWVAHSSEQPTRRLGAIVNKIKAPTRSMLALEKQVSLPPKVDWRNFNEKNFVTPVKDQGDCGSCVSFDVCAVLESLYLISTGKVKIFSEWDVFTRIGTCSTGATVESGLDALKAGVCDAACRDYQSDIVCPDRANRLTKIVSWNMLSTPLQAKTALQNGPIVASMAVYDDFFNYKSGVYKYVSGSLAGDHAVAIVGYDDVLGCWIVKNSWGTSFGENGFFRIAYNQCGMLAGDLQNPMFAEVLSAPAPEPIPTPVETGDLVLPSAGSLYIRPIIDGEVGISLSVNGNNLGLIKGMQHDYVAIGSFPIGKGIVFGLSKSAKKYHFVSVVQPTKNVNVWEVALGTTSNATVCISCVLR